MHKPVGCVATVRRNRRKIRKFTFREKQQHINMEDDAESSTCPYLTSQLLKRRRREAAEPPPALPQPFVWCKCEVFTPSCTWRAAPAASSAACLSQTRCCGTTDGCRVTPCRPVNSSTCDFTEHHRRQRCRSLFRFKPDILVFVNSCPGLKINPFDPSLSEWETSGLIVFVLNLVLKCNSGHDSSCSWALWIIYCTDRVWRRGNTHVATKDKEKKNLCMERMDF